MEKKTTHTPGNWIVADNKLSVTTQDKSTIIAHVKNNTDANLIASAPELLETSKEKDKEIDNLQRIIKEEREIRQRHEVTLSKMLAKQRDEIERLREALKGLTDYFRWNIGDPHFKEYKDAVAALSNQQHVTTLEDS